MRSWNPLNDTGLRAQIRSQRTHRWDIDRDINWQLEIDPQRHLLPLDQDAIAFPGASAEQRLALSQYVGLLLNATVGEMEDAILKLRDSAWERFLRERPVNPEMLELGDLFFEEETKHAATFGRYVDKFCRTMGIDRGDLDRLLPKVVGSRLLKSTMTNAKRGGFAFWWMVAAVEEVSVEFFRHLRAHERAIDPLYFSIHRRHLEEEARHRNYAFLMLELVHRQPTGLVEKLRRKTDSLRAQALTTTWVLGELTRFYEVKSLANKHPFFATLATCLPLLKEVSWPDLIHRLFVSSPFVSLILNPRHHRLARKAAEKLGVWSFPFPRPKLSPVMTPDYPQPKRRKRA